MRGRLGILDEVLAFTLEWNSSSKKVQNTMAYSPEGESDIDSQIEGSCFIATLFKSDYRIFGVDPRF